MPGSSHARNRKKIAVNKLAGTIVCTALAGGILLATTQDAQAVTALKVRAENVAKSHIGDPYAWGATGPHKFDCSGLTQYAYRQVGKTIPRTAAAQYNYMHHVSAANRQVGDSIFILNRYGVYHTGFYAGFWDGHGWMLDAPRTGSRVGYHQIHWYTDGAANWSRYARP
jgi:cell wall-associated NlpC family hydrolase